MPQEHPKILLIFWYNMASIVYFHFFEFVHFLCSLISNISEFVQSTTVSSDEENLESVLHRQEVQHFLLALALTNTIFVEHDENGFLSLESRPERSSFTILSVLLYDWCDWLILMYCEMKWISGVEVYQSSSPDEEALVKAARAYGVRLKEVLLLRIRIFIDFWIQIQFWICLDEICDCSEHLNISQLKWTVKNKFMNFSQWLNSLLREDACLSL